MPLDYRYNAGDRVLDPATGNYETTPGNGDAVIREMNSGVIEIDGGDYGNRAFELVRRGSDTPETREEIRRYYEEVGQRYVDAGLIRDLEVTADDPVGMTGLAIQVRFFDIMRNQGVDTKLPFVDLT